METSPLAIESFSHSWLSNVKPSSDGFDELLRSSLGSSDEAQKLTKSKGHPTEAQNFDFDIPISRTSVSLVHADELFSDGLIRPVFIERSKVVTSSNSDSILMMSGSSSSSSSGTDIPATCLRCHGLVRWRKASQRIMQKCLGYLRPFYGKVGCSRKSIRVDDIDLRAQEATSWNNSTQSSPQRSAAHSVGYWSDLESSIYDAVLHCKRSLGN